MALRPSVTGVAGSAPPPNAPHEVASAPPVDVAFENLVPQTLDALADKIDPSLVGLTASQMARQNERELAPLNPVPAGAPPIVKTEVVAASDIVAANVPAAVPVAAGGLHLLPVSDNTAKGTLAAPIPPQQMDAAGRQHSQALPARRLRTQPPPVATTAVSARPVQPASEKGGVEVKDASEKIVAPVRPVQASRGGQSHQPAASNTDSPSRGIPRADLPEGKTITGGFGAAADAQYFPLDGSELLKVVWLAMDELAARLQNDIRFGIAITYPRVAVKVQVIVEGFTLDVPMIVEKIAPPHDRTPLDMAESLGDQIVFVVSAGRREFDAAGNSETPPNALREQIGGIIPHKQAFGTGPQRVIADVQS